jgi:phosphoglycerate kinase
VVPVLEESLGKKIIFIGDSYGPEVESACINAKEGSVVLLENLRFNPQEQGSFKDAAGVKVY